jgi:ComF family protein
VAEVRAAPASAGAIAARAARALEAFALPQRCPACGAPADPAALLCGPCLERIPRLSVAVCARCLAAGGEPVGCARHPGHAVWPAWVYDERAALVVHALKYRERPRLAAALGEHLAAALPPGAAPDLVVEVPLHPARRRERGYDQAVRLADALARAAGVPRQAGALVRRRATLPQARLDARARRANLAGAFAVTEPRALSGRRVVVVDDVLTTGATLEACLDALVRAGARATGVTLAWAV